MQASSRKLRAGFGSARLRPRNKGYALRALWRSTLPISLRGSRGTPPPPPQQQLPVAVANDY